MQKQDEKYSYSRNVLARVLRLQRIRHEDIRQLLGIQTPLLNQVLQQTLQFFDMKKEYHLTESNTMHYIQDPKEKK